MPETTTAINACNIGVHMADENGILHDISGSANRAELQFSKQLGEYQVFGGSWVKRLSCKRDATMNLNIIYTTADDEGWAYVKDWWDNFPDDPRRFRIFAPEEAIGADDFDALWLISTMNVPFDGTQATPVVVALTLMQTDGIAIGTVAT